MSATDPGSAGDELNGFLRTTRVIAVEKHLLGSGVDARWAVCVEYLDGAPGARPAGGKIDYKEVLSAEDFAVYAKLREHRKRTSEREAIPAYAVFTNEQLAAIAQRRPQSREALQAIEGIGAAKTEKYGDAFLAIVAETTQP